MTKYTQECTTLYVLKEKQLANKTISGYNSLRDSIDVQERFVTFLHDVITDLVLLTDKDAIVYLFPEGEFNE